jgi:hypothetical protein
LWFALWPDPNHVDHHDKTRHEVLTKRKLTVESLAAAGADGAASDDDALAPSAADALAAWGRSVEMKAAACAPPPAASSSPGATAMSRRSTNYTGGAWSGRRSRAAHPDSERQRERQRQTGRHTGRHRETQRHTETHREKVP